MSPTHPPFTSFHISFVSLCPLDGTVVKQNIQNFDNFIRPKTQNIKLYQGHS